MSLVTPSLTALTALTAGLVPLAGIPADAAPASGHPQATITHKSTPKPRPAYTVKGKVITVRGDAGFASPSGNIVCSLNSSATCEIGRISYRPPRRPSSCTYAWGFVFKVVRKAAPVCANDSVWGATHVPLNPWFTATRAKPQTIAGDPVAVLPYGWTLRRGAISCTSTKTGVTCANTTTRHGFTVARTAFRIF